MANTKHITDRTERKTAKRAQRKAAKKVFHDLSKKQKKAFRKGETTGLKAFLAEQSS